MLEHPKSGTDSQGETCSDKTMGNEQTPPLEIAWLAGFFDGEGSIGVYGYKRYKAEGLSYTPKFQLASTSAGAIERVDDILKRIGVNVKIYCKEPSSPKHKEAWQIYFCKLSDISKVLPALLPYLVVKKPHAKLALHFVESRLRKGINRGGNKNIATAQFEQLGASVVGPEEIGYLKATGCHARTRRSSGASPVASR